VPSSEHVAFNVPVGACDCHVHVFLPQERYPLSPTRLYTTATATAEDLADFHRGLGIERTVIVQPSAYGTDNAATLEGIRSLGLVRARGVAVVAEDTPPAALDALDRSGIRGVRANLETVGEFEPAAAGEKLGRLAALVRDWGWHLQVYTRLSVVAALHEQLTRLPIPLVLDHFGGAQSTEGPDQAGFAALLSLVRSGKAYVKLSALYRSSTRAPDHHDMAPLAELLIAANPDRILWGSDWPHVDTTRGTPEAITPFFAVDTVRALNQLARWAPSTDVRHQILVENPARLYGF
jgi:predicted TIM-barrel fold metal-dependent hydrolase